MSKDLDFIISTDNPKAVQQQLLNIPNKVKKKAVGEHKSFIRISGMMMKRFGVDFRLIEPSAFYHTLQHFTGSKEHNIRIRQLVKARDEK